MHNGIMMCDIEQSDLQINACSKSDREKMVSGQFGVGQFGVGQFGATIRRGQFGANYNINFIENPAFTQRYFFVNPASISTIFFLSI